MKICILSDSHDNRFLLKAAAKDAVARGARCILHCGDIVAPTTLRALFELNVPVHAIHGNNTGDLYNMAALAGDDNNLIHYHGQDADIELAGKRIFIVHYPHYAQALALTGNYDVVCCGHDHRALIEPVTNINGQQTMLINPGTVGGVGKAPTYVMADLDASDFEVIAVPIDKDLAYNTPQVTPHS